MNSRLLTVVLCGLAMFSGVTAADELERQIESQLAASGDNRAQLSKALADVPAEQKESMRFLVAWMPPEDVKALPAFLLIENVALASQVRTTAAWQRTIPDDVFNDYVLPYACFDEPRDPWRADFHRRFWPLVKDCQTISEAAQLLNQRIFGELKVRYSTGRRRANQSPKESIEQGLASCSGLSVILVDACRSVGVPARIAGIPKWANKDGNHTWVEIWDNGWHYTGAAEFDANGLNRAWFAGDAALADPASKLSSIYAVKYKPSGIHFPLPWNPDDQSIHAVNVTERYTSKRVPLQEGFARVLFTAKTPDGQRIALAVSVTPQAADGTAATETEAKDLGKTRDETRDTNDFLETVLNKKQAIHVVAKDKTGKSMNWDFTLTDEDQQMISWTWVPK